MQLLGSVKASLCAVIHSLFTNALVHKWCRSWLRKNCHRLIRYRLELVSHASIKSCNGSWAKYEHISSLILLISCIPQPTIHQLFISAFMLVSKITCDDTYSNKSSWTDNPFVAGKLSI